MPRVHISCDTRVKVSDINGSLYCPKCDAEVVKVDTYKVSKHYFGRDRSELEEEKQKKLRKKIRHIRRESRRKNR